LKNSFTWWEKTVEYAFLAAAVTAGKCHYAAPLSGKEERAAGDAVFGVPNAFVLIEFKRDRRQISEEESLFHDYEKAAIALKSYRHHQIIYAEESPDASGLNLLAETYFHGCRRESALACLNFGVEEEVFKTYLHLLFDLKKEDGRSSSGQILPEALSTVLGISSNGNIVQAVPLHKYAPKLFPVEIYRPSDSPTPTSVPRPG
jgi:hypothetical protein